MAMLIGIITFKGVGILWFDSVMIVALCIASFALGKLSNGFSVTIKHYNSLPDEDNEMNYNESIPSKEKEMEQAREQYEGVI